MEKKHILQQLQRLALPDGRNLVSADMVRAIELKGGHVSFVIEAPDSETARKMEVIRASAEKLVAELDGVEKVTALLTAHTPYSEKAAPSALSASPADAPPNLKIGRHSKPQAAPAKLRGIKNIIAIGSGKGGVGKSTLSANLAVSLAKAGRRVGLLDADIYGPSQPRMMGVSARPTSPDGKAINPLFAHGVTMMSIGLMLDPQKAVVWRGPMLMGALQQMLGQVRWGELDILLIDLPPGTGDVQLTLCQNTELRGALVVSTPQDVALIDVRKAIDMFRTLKTEILGLVENMSVYTCPKCGHEAHLFGRGGVRAEAESLGLPLLAEMPLELEIRRAGDSGVPIAASDSLVARPYHALAADMIARNWV